MAAKKLTNAGVTEETTPTGDDIAYIVNDPGGTPGGRKVTLTNLAKAIRGLLNITAATDKASPVAADEVLIGDSAASGATKKTDIVALVIQAAVTQHEAAIDHDALASFAADEHVAHSAVDITAGAGLTGGGDISASRTLNVGAGEGIAVAADAVAVDVDGLTEQPAPGTGDFVLIHDVGLGALRKVDWANLPGFAGAVQEALFDAQTILAAVSDDTPVAVTIAENDIVGRLPSGDIGGITAADLVEETTPAAGDYLLGWEGSAGAIRKFDVDDLGGGGGGGIDWSDPVDADVVPDSDGTRDLGADAIRFAEIFGDNVTITDDADVGTLQARAVVPNTETTSFVFALTDAGKLTTISNAGATTATIPANATVAFPINTILYLEQTGDGPCTWTPANDVTINYDTSAHTLVTKKFGYSFARKTATDTWEVAGSLVPINPAEALVISASDEGTEIITGTAKVTFRMPYAFTATDIKASVTDAPTGASLVIDVNDESGSILDTQKLEIEATEKTTRTATTEASLVTTDFAEDEEITVDFDQVGSTFGGTGVKIALLGRRT